MVTVSEVKCTVSEAKYTVNMLSVLNNFTKKGKIFNSQIFYWKFLRFLDEKKRFSVILEPN